MNGVEKPHKNKPLFHTTRKHNHIKQDVGENKKSGTRWMGMKWRKKLDIATFGPVHLPTQSIRNQTPKIRKNHTTTHPNKQNNTTTAVVEKEK